VEFVLVWKHTVVPLKVVANRDHQVKKFAKHPNIIHAKTTLEDKDYLKKAHRPSFVILQFSKTLLKA